MTHLAYHNRGATPLMFAIMTGKFEAAKILVEAGARKDLKNDRGRTAMDLLEEMYLVSFFRGQSKGDSIWKPQLALQSLPRGANQKP